MAGTLFTHDHLIMIPLLDMRFFLGEFFVNVVNLISSFHVQEVGVFVGCFHRASREQYP